MNDTDEVLDDAAREQRRAELLRGLEALPKATEAYQKERDKVRAATEAEEARARKAKLAMRDLEAAVAKAHAWMAHCHECEALLFAEFVPRPLREAQSRTWAALSRAQREHADALGLVSQVQRVIDHKSLKTVDGVLRDGNGNPLREPVDPKNPHVEPRRRRGPVRNPNYWTSDEERKHMEGVLEGLELKAAEAESVADAADKLNREAEKAVQDALDAAMKGLARG